LTVVSDLAQLTPGDSALASVAALCHDLRFGMQMRLAMKKVVIAAALIVGSLLTGCNQLTSYTIDEQEINQALAKRNHFAKDIGLPGVAQVHIVLTNLNSQIGRKEPNKVTLTGDAHLDMSSLFGNQKATMKLTLKALPAFNHEQGAIYLQEMEVLNATVEPQKMQSMLQTIVPYLNQALRSYFNQKPAYVLSEDRSKGEAIAKRLAKGIEVKPGKIVIPFTQ
jgi:hypothetical protein